ALARDAVAANTAQSTAKKTEQAVAGAGEKTNSAAAPIHQGQAAPTPTPIEPAHPGAAQQASAPQAAAPAMAAPAVSSAPTADARRSHAELTVPAVALCREVHGFGLYEPIEPCRFQAGKDHPVVVYCEVENFSSQLNASKQWETRLTQELALYHETDGFDVLH